MTKKRALKRPSGKKRYKRLFVIACEGKKTEPQYFSLLKVQNSVIKILKPIHSAPGKVLQRMQAYLEQNPLLETDEAWLVIDKDDWTKAQLKPLFAWTKEQKNYELGLSNPNFEYWLLLHFEDGKKILSGRDCLSRLKKHLPNYDKNVDQSMFTKEVIYKAIKRAQLRYNVASLNPASAGNITTVHILVERILIDK